MFATPSGTGKTLGREVLSNELQFDLYSIDLPAIVNRYIGETEKNLRRLFDATSGRGHTLLHIQSEHETLPVAADVFPLPRIPDQVFW